LRKLTGSIPLVIVAITDPVASGFAASMARPGGNITGFTNFEYTIGGKWAELLKQIAPKVEHLGGVLNPANIAHPKFARIIEISASSLGIRTTSVPVRSVGELRHGIEAFGEGRNGALIILPDTVTLSQPDLITQLAIQYQLASAYPYR